MDRLDKSANEDITIGVGTRDTGTALDFGGFDTKLVLQIQQLQVDAASAQHLVARSHNSLYEVLAKCVALAAIHGKDHAVFKRPFKDKSRNIELEYQTSTKGRPPSPFRPVIWQVFGNPPAQTLYRYTSVLSLVEHVADEQGVDLADKKKVVAFMKKFGSLDTMVDAWRTIKNGTPIYGGGDDDDNEGGEGTEGKNNGPSAMAPKLSDALTAIGDRAPVASLSANLVNSQQETQLSLFAGQWSKNGTMAVRLLDPLSYPDDKYVVDAWKAEIRRLQAAASADPLTAFLRDICTLAQGVRERVRPRDDQTITTNFERRITFESDGNALTARVGLVDTDEGITLDAKLPTKAWKLRQPASVYRSSAENHADIIAKGTRGDLTKRCRDAVLEIGADGATEKAMGVVAKLSLQAAQGPETVYLVKPSKLPGKQMRIGLPKWDYKSVIPASEIVSMTPIVEGFTKCTKLNDRGKFQRLGYAFALKCGRKGLFVTNYDGDDEYEVEAIEHKSSGKAFTLHFRTDDWIACTKAITKLKGIEQIVLNVGRKGFAHIGIETAVGKYAFFVPACDADGVRMTNLVTRTK